jgi:hypothetical protein
MNQLEIHLDAQPPEFSPGSAMTGNVAWQIDSAAKVIELRLFWYTQAIKQRDAQIVDTMRIDDPQISGRRNFSFHLPAGPYSFQGKIIKLTWSLALVMEPGGIATSVEFVMGPGGRAVDPNLNPTSPKINA